MFIILCNNLYHLNGIMLIATTYQYERLTLDQNHVEL